MTTLMVTSEKCSSSLTIQALNVVLHHQMVPCLGWNFKIFEDRLPMLKEIILYHHKQNEVIKGKVNKCTKGDDSLEMVRDNLDTNGHHYFNDTLLSRLKITLRELSVAVLNDKCKALHFTTNNQPIPSAVYSSVGKSVLETYLEPISCSIQHLTICMTKNLLASYFQLHKEVMEWIEQQASKHTKDSIIGYQLVAIQKAENWLNVLELAILSVALTSLHFDDRYRRMVASLDAYREEEYDNNEDDIDHEGFWRLQVLDTCEYLIDTVHEIVNSLRQNTVSLTGIIENHFNFRFMKPNTDKQRMKVKKYAPFQDFAMEISEWINKSIDVKVNLIGNCYTSCYNPYYTTINYIDSQSMTISVPETHYKLWSLCLQHSVILELLQILPGDIEDTEGDVNDDVHSMTYPLSILCEVMEHELIKTCMEHRHSCYADPSPDDFIKKDYPNVELLHETMRNINQLIALGHREILSHHNYQQMLRASSATNVIQSTCHHLLRRAVQREYVDIARGVNLSSMKYLIKLYDINIEENTDKSLSPTKPMPQMLYFCYEWAKKVKMLHGQLLNHVTLLDPALVTEDTALEYLFDSTLFLSYFTKYSKYYNLRDAQAYRLDAIIVITMELTDCDNKDMYSHSTRQFVENVLNNAWNVYEDAFDMFDQTTPSEHNDHIFISAMCGDLYHTYMQNFIDMDDMAVNHIREIGSLYQLWKDVKQRICSMKREDCKEDYDLLLLEKSCIELELLAYAVDAWKISMEDNEKQAWPFKMHQHVAQGLDDCHQHFHRSIINRLRSKLTLCRIPIDNGPFIRTNPETVKEVKSCIVSNMILLENFLFWQRRMVECALLQADSAMNFNSRFFVSCTVSEDLYLDIVAPLNNLMEQCMNISYPLNDLHKVLGFSDVSSNDFDLEEGGAVSLPKDASVTRLTDEDVSAVTNVIIDAATKLQKENNRLRSIELGKLVSDSNCALNTTTYHSLFLKR